MQENGITDDTPMTRDTLEKLQSALEKVKAKELNLTWRKARRIPAPPPS